MKNIRVELELPCVVPDYMSLKNDNLCRTVPTFNHVNSVLVRQYLVKAIDFLKVGKRAEAISILTTDAKHEPNEAILYVKRIEQDLYQFIKANTETWFDDVIGSKEFLPIQELVKLKQASDYYGEKTIIEITGNPPEK